MDLGARSVKMHFSKSKIARSNKLSALNHQIIIILIKIIIFHPLLEHSRVTRLYCDPQLDRLHLLNDHRVDNVPGK